ncbi:MAG: hypothetical protein KDE22_11045 [Rhodobacterales bacterium]|nr:hypothetical protein [Rhodobacterales bacterium]
MKTMSDEDFRRYVADLGRRMETINSRKELSSFIFMLCKGYREGAFEEQDAEDYLSGTGSLFRAMDSWYRNNDIKDDPDVPTWRMMARVLLASFSHS